MSRHRNRRRALQNELSDGTAVVEATFPDAIPGGPRKAIEEALDTHRTLGKLAEDLLYNEIPKIGGVEVADHVTVDDVEDALKAKMRELGIKVAAFGLGSLRDVSERLHEAAEDVDELLERDVPMNTGGMVRHDLIKVAERVRSLAERVERADDWGEAFNLIHDDRLLSLTFEAFDQAIEEAEDAGLRDVARDLGGLRDKVGDVQSALGEQTLDRMSSRDLCADCRREKSATSIPNLSVNEWMGKQIKKGLEDLPEVSKVFIDTQFPPIVEVTGLYRGESFEIRVHADADTGIYVSSKERENEVAFASGYPADSVVRNVTAALKDLFGDY